MQEFKKWFKKQSFESLVQDCKSVENRHKVLAQVLRDNEIECEKYHHTIYGGPLLFDKYKAVIRLSRNGKSFKIHCFKPEVNV